MISVDGAGILKEGDIDKDEVSIPNVVASLIGLKMLQCFGIHGLL